MAPNTLKRNLLRPLGLKGLSNIPVCESAVHALPVWLCTTVHYNSLTLITRGAPTEVLISRHG